LEELNLSIPKIRRAALSDRVNGKAALTAKLALRIETGEPQHQGQTTLISPFSCQTLR